MKILVGLGNPGQKYEGNRHNIGFMAVDAIADRYGAGQWRKRFQSLATEIDIDRVRYLVLKPQTYMNESGRSVGEAMRFYKISPADVIVFHDELDLEPGKLRVKIGGGHAGHNGLKSITAHIGSDFQRVRLGIGHPGSREAVTHYVLNDFARADRQWLEPLLDGIARGVPHLVTGQDGKFMNDVARVMRPDTQRGNGRRAAAAPADSQTETKPTPQPTPTAQKTERPAEPELATAMAGGSPPPQQQQRSETSLGAKLKAWFKRGS